MSKLILTRHGQSIWNAENRFTGWVDVDLSKKGVEEAEKSGELIKKLNIKIDISYTSFLSNNGIRGFGDGLRTVSNPMEFVLGLENPNDINLIVEEFCNWLLPVSDEISSSDKEELVEIIVGGNPNIWEDELNEYFLKIVSYKLNHVFGRQHRINMSDNFHIIEL